MAKQTKSYQEIEAAAAAEDATAAAATAELQGKPADLRQEPKTTIVLNVCGRMVERPYYQDAS